MELSIITARFNGRGASYGPTLPNKQSVVYIEPRERAVTIAPQNTYNTANIWRSHTISPPCVLFYNYKGNICAVSYAENIVSSF
jgi:hypothetical protein